MAAISGHMPTYVGMIVFRPARRTGRPASSAYAPDRATRSKMIEAVTIGELLRQGPVYLASGGDSRRDSPRTYSQIECPYGE